MKPIAVNGFRIRDRRVRQHLLHMCDLTGGITRALRLLPASLRPLLQVCFRGNTDINR
ncbi:hypothetical protein ACVIHI_001968 [Bradyrhizobium sp. USDA 4524]|uniref:hypothetical protein n=1 Tax=Bradyrhizobium TaxID=374 RepID=UPI00209EA6D7|nr:MULTISPECIES: hypothetical protein [Bradyrhizobium]MCP1845110.1 hypothetical protein [Bradyrhizobium sp. USDA 4538]MCP1905675.1 hypothetical protein [Bradyrhizobium sp. USDA 4537]MCP1988669.1 hypothetical protein [Bradyrhizobium sp. USDA 4539]MCP3418417.1 hypothetical protein [Bradyrhizobium brasilense]